jgi:hypothetical protein
MCVKFRICLAKYVDQTRPLYYTRKCGVAPRARHAALVRDAYVTPCRKGRKFSCVDTNGIILYYIQQIHVE